MSEPSLVQNQDILSAEGERLGAEGSGSPERSTPPSPSTSEWLLIPSAAQPDDEGVDDAVDADEGPDREEDPAEPLALSVDWDAEYEKGKGFFGRVSEFCFLLFLASFSASQLHFGDDYYYWGQR